VEGIWNTRVARATPVRVTLTNTGRQAVGGRVRLSLPTGWSPTGAKPFRLSRGDESVTIEFALTAPRNAPAGRYQVAAVAVDDAGREYRLGSEELTYPHIRSRVHTVVATSEVARMSVALPPLRQVGYVRGAADRVPEALRAAGVPLVLLDPATIGSRSLSGFDAIVIGPRAFETEPALALANVPLLEYARAGGTLIVQYQQYGYFLAGLPPLPMALASREPGQAISTASTGSQPRTAGVTTALIGGHDRVTDERAEVRIIDPANPAVTRPNRIGSSDWDGWVQERGLYIPREWDPAFRPVLETGDPDEAPLRGALLIAPLGKGRYVYTGLSFFRQLPAGVPGGFRLFANLLGLGWTSRSRSAAPEVKVEAE
jgi:hypothetical protein